MSCNFPLPFPCRPKEKARTLCVATLQCTILTGCPRGGLSFPGTRLFVCLFFSVCSRLWKDRNSRENTSIYLGEKRRTRAKGLNGGVLLLPWMVRWSIAGIPCSTMSPVTICACTWVKRVIKCSECPSLSKETTQRPRLEYWTSRSGVRVFNRSATQAATKQCNSMIMWYHCLSS